MAYIGCVGSSSGGGNYSHTWSTTEQEIGTWIDGSTVYEKTFVFNEPLYESHKVYDISNDFTGFTPQLIDYDIVIQFSPDGSNLFVNNNYFGGYDASGVAHAVVEMGVSTTTGNNIVNIVADVPHVWRYQNLYVTLRYIKHVSQ